MKIIYSDQEPFDGVGKAVMLCGPTPRSQLVESWRPRAIDILNQKKYSGIVCVPEPSNNIYSKNYLSQTEWEYSCLYNCSKIVFWVPRKMETMPALTTNIEFGYWMAEDPKKVFYGRPDDAQSIRYLDWMYKKKTDRNPFCDLEQMLEFVTNGVL